jgi:hypothetical protein
MGSVSTVGFMHFDIATQLLEMYPATLVQSGPILNLCPDGVGVVIDPETRRGCAGFMAVFVSTKA